MARAQCRLTWRASGVVFSATVPDREGHRLAASAGKGAVAITCRPFEELQLPEATVSPMLSWLGFRAPEGANKKQQCSSQRDVLSQLHVPSQGRTLTYLLTYLLTSQRVLKGAY